MSPLLRRTVWDDLDDAGRARVLSRPSRDTAAEVASVVSDVLAAVQRDGDAALREFARRFDGVDMASFAVVPGRFDEADASIDGSLRTAVKRAAERIENFHRATMAATVALDTAPGVRCERMFRPIRRVGLYIPAGSAPLPSTVLMLGIPARLAGCRDLVLCTPPDRDGRVAPEILHAARTCGITRVFAIGGAQAIGAMAFGTRSVPACDKLFGPGNAWVTEAKRQVAAGAQPVAIDLPAGPSELLVIADDGANPAFVAADLLSQAEHGPDSQVLLLSPSGPLLDAVDAALSMQLASLPRRDTATRALAASRSIQVRDLDQAMAISNAYAPEHLILAVREPRALLGQVACAGSVFLGDWAPEALGDYCSGTNHVLPTGGAARAIGGLGVADFQVSISVQEVSRAGLSRIGPDAVTLARAERLEAHARAVALRLSAA